VSGQEEGNEEEDTRVNNKLRYQWVQNEGIRARIGWQRMEKAKHKPVRNWMYLAPSIVGP